MPRSLPVLMCLGIAASTPALLLSYYLPHSALGAGLMAGMGAICAVVAGTLWSRQLSSHRRALAALEERRRHAIAEAADLQGLELSLLADLEEAEAELQAHQAVADSLSEAIHHTLTTVEAELHEGHAPELTRHLEEALELVADARDFIIDPAIRAPAPERFGLYSAIDQTLMTLRGATLPRLTWSIDDAVPANAVGRSERLSSMLISAANAAARVSPQDPHLRLTLLDRGETTGLVISWSETASYDDDLSNALGTRLSRVLDDDTLIGCQGASLTWWMQGDSGKVAVVAPTLPEATVLLAASHARPRARIRRLLERWGLHVDTARTRQEALFRLDSTPYDILLLDLEDRTVETLEHIRSHERLGAIPILLLTPDIENVVWFTPTQDPGFVRHVGQKSLLQSVESALQHRPPPHRGQSQTAQVSTRVLALEPNPSLAAVLVRAAADAGCEVRVVATADALTEAAIDHWDLVLIGRHAIDPARAVRCLSGLDPEVPRLLVGPSVDGITRNAARACGLTDAAVRPSDAQGLLALISLTQPTPGEQEAPYSTLSATASRKLS